MLGVFDLFGNGDFQALLQQTIQIPFSAVVRNTAHGYRLILVFLTRRQRDVEGFGGDDGVVVKQFVKISHAKKEQRVAGLGLQMRILLHHGCELRIGNRAMRRMG